MAIAGAIARQNIHAAAERDGEVRVVATHTLAPVEDLPGRHRGARMLVAEGDVPMDEIAERHAVRHSADVRVPARRRATGYG